MNTERNALIEQTKDRIGELEAMLERQRRILSDCGWVVVSAIGFPIKFDIDTAGNVTAAKSTNLESCSRLSRANAVHLAAAMRDGKGDAGKAVSYVQAIQDHISDAHGLLETLQKVPS